jgi:hypothetical protein
MDVRQLEIETGTVDVAIDKVTHCGPRLMMSGDDGRATLLDGQCLVAF